MLKAFKNIFNANNNFWTSNSIQHLYLPLNKENEFEDLTKRVSIPKYEDIPDFDNNSIW